MSEIEHQKIVGVCKPKRRYCIDPSHATRCHWSSPNGNFCNRSTFGNRNPIMIENDEGRKICELFKLRIQTDPRPKKGVNQ